MSKLNNLHWDYVRLKLTNETSFFKMTGVLQPTNNLGQLKKENDLNMYSACWHWDYGTAEINKCIVLYLF